MVIVVGVYTRTTSVIATFLEERFMIIQRQMAVQIILDGKKQGGKMLWKKFVATVDFFDKRILSLAIVSSMT